MPMEGKTSEMPLFQLLGSMLVEHSLSGELRGILGWVSRPRPIVNSE
jgi:hypothetical protein